MLSALLISLPCSKILCGVGSFQQVLGTIQQAPDKDERKNVSKCQSKQPYNIQNH